MAKQDKSVQTLRGFAIILVVMGHVIGYKGDEGMKVADGSFWHNISKIFLSSVLVYIFIFQTEQIKAQEVHCHHSINTETEYINGIIVSPGDTICIESGHRSSLYFGNICGTLDKPLIVINKGGIVEIDSDKGYGISISNCQYMLITGSGNSADYGIQIKNVPSGSGIKVGNLSSDIEISNIEISNTEYMGIVAKTDPTCSFAAVRDSFTMYNIHIHHNYLHNIGTEGLYIGNSFYLGVNLDDCDTTVLPHLLDGVEIHHNIVENTGWDGIQLGCALFNSSIHHNQISLDSQAEKVYQMSGIMVNPGTNADVYNNSILNGKGTGIALQSTGGQKIYNNLIVNAGQGYDINNQTTTQKFGIYSKYKMNVGNDSSYTICNNTIINPKSDGIRFQNSHTDANKFLNNIIINPGAYDYYENNGNLSNSGTDSYIYIYYDGIDFMATNNIMRRSCNELYFIDTINTNYQIEPSSPAYNTGLDLINLGISFDILDNSRPFGNNFDIGAFESYDASSSHYINDAENLITIYFDSSKQENVIQIDELKEINRIFIYNSNGYLVDLHKKPSGNTLETSHLAAGCYVIIVETDKKTIRKKYLKF